MLHPYLGMGFSNNRMNVKLGYMKIAYISAGNLPSERANTIQVMKVCQAFTRLGHDVTLFTPASDQPNPDWDSLALHYGLSYPFNIHFFPLDPVWKRRSIAWKGIRLAREMKAELLYTRALPPAVMGLLLNIPVILEMHQLPGGRFGPFWYRLFLRWSGRKFLVPITHALKHSLEKKFHPTLSSDQVVVAPSGVDLDRYQDIPDSITARSSLDLPEGFTVVCSGHLYRGRGMEMVIDLAGRMPEINFLWTGGTSEDVEIWRNKILARGLQNLTLTGFIPNQLLPLYQAASDALFIPYEAGFTNSGGENISEVSSPMKLFEYMAAERPILSSDLPVLHEVLNEKNAIFCSPGDVSAWQEALITLQEDPSQGKKIARQARLDVEQYSWEERCRSILAGFVKGGL
jgi:glycosyltransferase involved in cell wall biosynthesis